MFSLPAILNINTDYRVVYGFIGLSIFFVLITLQNSQSKTMNIILYVNILIIVIIAYNYFKEQKSNTKVVDNILGKVETDLNDIYNTESKDVAIFKLMMKNDPYLNYSFKTILKFKDNNLQVYQNLINYMYKFFTLYRLLLKGTSSVTEEFQTLLDRRNMMLQYVNMLYYNITYDVHKSTIERLYLILQSSTYKFVNIIKNKYDLQDFVILPYEQQDNSPRSFL